MLSEQDLAKSAQNLLIQRIQGICVAATRVANQKTKINSDVVKCDMVALPSPSLVLFSDYGRTSLDQRFTASLQPE